MYRTKTALVPWSMAIVSILVVALAGAGSAQEPARPLSRDCSRYENVPLPAEAEKASVPKSPPSCASYRSYRGIGRPVNFEKARACAWQERLAQKDDLGQNEHEPSAWVVGGSLILADMYYNGAGVQRNVPLAFRFACEWENAAVGLALEHIEKDGLSPKEQVEFCDYATTTFTMNFCSGYASEIEDSRRTRYYESLQSSMSAGQRDAFTRLLDAQRAYLEAHGSEVDQGGTIRVVRTLESEKILKERFYSQLVRFERKEWPRMSQTQVQSADRLLNNQYAKTIRQLRNQSKEDSYEGSVTPDGLIKAERSWIMYRDAWSEFAKMRYPSAMEDIVAEIVIDRYRLLKTIP